MRARRTESGGILLGNGPINEQHLTLPCGKCDQCRLAQAKAWALRCQLELHDHDNAAFTTLTYDDASCPPTLQRDALQRFLKRLRDRAQRRAATGHLRFFACGEYGEKNNRPHYHAIIFGLSDADRSIVDQAWGLGRTHTTNATPATIAYTAGYTAKKLGWRDQARQERVDPTTGEVYTWQPPFIQMSRRPGLGATAKKHVQSWRLFAVSDAHKMPVPRYLHEAWKAQATPLQQEELNEEKLKYALTRNTTPAQIAAQITIKEKAIQQSREARKL